jgi:hypothetical protein
VGLLYRSLRPETERDHTLIPRIRTLTPLGEWVQLQAARIATALCIAEYTVQDHLKHIFAKVGVHSRRALVQRLYLEHLYEGGTWPTERSSCTLLMHAQPSQRRPAISSSPVSTASPADRPAT